MEPSPLPAADSAIASRPPRLLVPPPAARRPWEGSFFARVAGWRNIERAGPWPFAECFAEENPWLARWRDAGASKARGGRWRDALFAFALAAFCFPLLFGFAILYILDLSRLFRVHNFHIQVSDVIRMLGVASIPALFLAASTAMAGHLARRRLEQEGTTADLLLARDAAFLAPKALRWLAAVQSRWFCAAAGRLLSGVVALLLARVLIGVYLGGEALIELHELAAFGVCGVTGFAIARAWCATAYLRTSVAALAPTAESAFWRSLWLAAILLASLVGRFAAYATIGGLALGDQIGVFGAVALSSIGESIVAGRRLAQAEALWTKEGPLVVESIRASLEERDAGA